MTTTGADNSRDSSPRRQPQHISAARLREKEKADLEGLQGYQASGHPGGVQQPAPQRVSRAVRALPIRCDRRIRSCWIP